jgi:hypothetical protein
MKKVKAEEIVTWFSGAAGGGPESGDFEIEKPGGFQRIGDQPSV